MRRRVSCGVLALALLLVGGEAGAWQARWCNGQRVSWWGHQPPMMDVEARWGETAWGRGFRSAMAAWNDGGAARHAFRWRAREFDRVVYGNGRNEVAPVRAERIDGNLGLTRVRRQACSAWPWPSTDGQIIEADVMVAVDLPQPNAAPINNCDLYVTGAFGVGPVPAARLYKWSRTATILHEFGHALGLLHEDHAMALMMTSGGEGRYCGAPQFAPHPDDLAGLRALYGPSRQPLNDLAASAFRYDPARINRIWMVDRQRTVERCPGALFDVGWAVANRGSLVAGFQVEWYASRSRAFNRADDVLLSVSRGLMAPARYWDGRHTLRMSRHLPAGIPHYLGYRIVPDGPDSQPLNNLAYNATRIVRRRPGECR